MKNALIVGVGGFIGCLLRYLASLGVYRLLDAPKFPYPTFLVNVGGCLLTGFLNVLIGDTQEVGQPAELRLLLIVGLLGGFTTFSTFGYESLELLRDGKEALALLNVVAHIVGGFAAVWLGMKSARFVR